MSERLGVEALVADLRAERGRLFAALDAVAPDSMTTPGLVGEWSARELIAHLGYWTGHAVELIHAVEQGRSDEVGVDDPPTDEVNATVARVARTTDLATVRRREAASCDALVERLGEIEPGLLEVSLSDGTTLGDAVSEDGPGHYREHADALEALLAERPHG